MPRLNALPAFLLQRLPALVGAALLVSCTACGHAKLDDSFGIRNREIFRVQNSARNSREVVTSGQAAESAMAKHYMAIAPSDSGSGGGGGGSSPSGPLKIPGLSH